MLHDVLHSPSSYNDISQQEEMYCKKQAIFHLQIIEENHTDIQQFLLLYLVGPMMPHIYSK